jgi:hypothetical protein
MGFELKTMLEDANQAILTGNFKKLERLTAQLAAESNLLSMVEPQDLVALRAQAMRNATCLLGAISGVKSARRRLADIAAAAQGLTTYDRRGGKATVAQTAKQTKRV